MSPNTNTTDSIMILVDSPDPALGRHRISSSLDDFTMLELAVQGADAATRNVGDSIVLREVDLAESTKIPQSTLVIVTETENLREDACAVDGSTSLLPMLSDFDISFSKLKVRDWDGQKFYSDFVKEGLEYNNKDADKIIMLFESPSSIPAGGNAFHNHGALLSSLLVILALFCILISPHNHLLLFQQPSSSSMIGQRQNQQR